MDAEKPNRPRWRKKRWQAAAALWLALLYPASGGPVAWASTRGLLPPPLDRFFTAFYIPIGAVTLEDWSRPRPGFGWWWAYIDFFRPPEPPPAPPRTLPARPRPVYARDAALDRTLRKPTVEDDGINRTEWTSRKAAP